MFLPAFLAAELAADVLARHAYRELLDRQIDERLPEGAPSPSVDPPRESGSHPDDSVRLAVASRAVEEWRRVVQEPPGHNWLQIDSYIRGGEGLGWPSAALQDSGDTKVYTRNGQFQWCGAFAAWAWGEHLDADVRKHYLASTYRIDRWTRGTGRWIAPQDILPGDIGVCGPRAKLAHIFIAIDSPQEVDGVLSVETIEGNATGPGPDGSRYEGVIRRRRPLAAPDDRIYRVHFGVRPAAEDQDGR